MTHNCTFSVLSRDATYEEIKEWAKTCTGFVLFSENDWFNGRVSYRQIRGAGFEREEDLAVFKLTFGEHLTWFSLTEDELKWGYDSMDFDF